MRVTQSKDHHTEHVDDTDGWDGYNGVEVNHLVVRYSKNHKAVLLYICHLYVVCHKLCHSDTQS